MTCRVYSGLAQPSGAELSASGPSMPDSVAVRVRRANEQRSLDRPLLVEQ
jgi:hypothetical protein